MLYDAAPPLKPLISHGDAEIQVSFLAVYFFDPDPDSDTENIKL
jgi:hypothetical protein